ncbi:unnamed protein product, partial [Mesorhabditis spiculigera]
MNTWLTQRRRVWFHNARELRPHPKCLVDGRYGDSMVPWRRRKEEKAGAGDRGIRAASDASRCPDCPFAPMLYLGQCDVTTRTSSVKEDGRTTPRESNVTPMFSTSAWMRGNDPTGEQKAYLDVADAIKSSALLLHGHLDQTFQMAKCWNGTNNGDRYAKYHETEAHAIFNVNTMYALTLDCQWGQALRLVDRAIAQFGPRASDRIKGHLKLAKALIKFGSRLFGCDLEGAAEQLPLIEQYCPCEHVIRLALHHACTGQLSEAIQLLNAYRPKVAGDVHTFERVRLLSVLGNLHTVNRNLTEAEASLVKAVRLARVSQAKPLMWLTTHLARVMIEQNKFDEAAAIAG